MWWQIAAPQRILLDLGFVKIYWYGLLVALAVGAALWVIAKTAQKKNFDLEKVYSLLFYVLIFGFIGARFWEVVGYSWFYFKDHPLDIVKVWQGGLAIQGALAFGIATIIIWCHGNKESIWKYLDLIALAVPLGQAIGRFGNYFNQELFGLPTNGWWGIYIDPINRPWAFTYSTLFHPVFLYESLLLLALFFWLWRLSKSNRPGEIIGWYLIGYGIIRFCLEFVRIDAVGGILGLRWPQIIALVMIMAGLAILIKKRQVKPASS